MNPVQQVPNISGLPPSVTTPFPLSCLIEDEDWLPPSVTTPFPLDYLIGDEDWGSYTSRYKENTYSAFL